MPCSLCGDICRCSSEKESTPAPRWRAEPESSIAEHPDKILKLQEASEPNPPVASEVALSRAAVAPPREDSSAWRQEVAARLNRYQSRRKPRPPRYPSLRLRFEGSNPDLANGSSTESSTFSPGLLSNQALALDEFAAGAPASMPDPLALQGAQFIEGSPALPRSEERSV